MLRVRPGASAVCSLALLVAVGIAVRAQEPNDPPGFRLEGERPPQLQNGRIAFAEGVADGTGQRFMLSDLEIVQPVVLAIIAERDDAPVEMVLGRDNWNENIRHASTAEKGAAGFHLRTQGDIRIFVKSTTPEPGKYLLIAWTGDPVKPPMPGLLTYGPTQPPSRWGLWAGAGALALVLLGAGLFLRQRKNAAGAAVAVALCLAGVSLRAQPPGPVSLTLDQIQNPNSSWNARADSLINGVGRFNNVSAPFNIINQATTAGFSALNMWNESENFTGDDAGYMPTMPTSGVPGLMASCDLGEEASACHACYDRAHSELQGMMWLLERLRANYDSTKRFNDAAISFGDSTSGIHGASGLAWQSQRPGILAQFQHYTQTYETKRQGMMGSLRHALDAIGACEAEFSHNPDWYNRYGFVYYQFMDARYKH